MAVQIIDRPAAAIRVTTGAAIADGAGSESSRRAGSGGCGIAGLPGTVDSTGRRPCDVESAYGAWSRGPGGVAPGRDRSPLLCARVGDGHERQLQRRDLAPAAA